MGSDLIEIFKKLTGGYPYEYQKEAIEHLLDNKSLIIRAPTGAGKTEISLIPFIYSINDKLPSQLIYSLPTRTLVESIGERATKYASLKKLRVAIHHGKKASSSLFEEDLIITTIDQTAGAYLSVPLSMPKKWGNIFVGGISSALTVFDEVHTLHPEKGLQTLTAIVVQSAKLGIPSIVMSATLPDAFINGIKERIEKNGGKAEIVDVEDESEIESRKNRKVELINRLDKELNADIILKEAEKHGKVIVVVNTVERAQKIYLDIMEKNPDRLTILLHSRYLENDRAEKERILQEIFGKNGKGECIFISTQIIEVGMDISSPLILSEVAPIDSLIQRAGRCARWGGKGEFHVFGLPEDAPNPYAPYLKDLVEKTIAEIKKRGNFVLDWGTEIKLVNSILSDYFEYYLNPYLFYSRLGELAKAVYEGRRSTVEKNVREIFSCDVTLHKNPESLEYDKILALPRIRVDVRVLISKFKKLRELGVKIYKLMENPVIEDYESKYTLIPVSSSEEIAPFELYILNGIGYSPDVGLLFDVSNAISFEPQEVILNMATDKLEYKTKKETWVDHSKNTLWVLDHYLIPRYHYVIQRFGKYFGYGFNELVEHIRLITALHDLGKLNIDWQKKVGWDGKTPLAHSGEYNNAKLPPHATVSARALQLYLESLFEEDGVFKAFYLAIAHHHAPWSSRYCKYRLIPNFYKFVEEVWDMPKELIKDHDSSNRLEFKYVDLAEENEAYRLYGLLSKLLRISDRLATGGVGYESIFLT